MASRNATGQFPHRLDRRLLLREYLSRIVRSTTGGSTMSATARSNRSRSFYVAMAIVSGMGFLAMLPSGIFLTLSGGTGLGLVIGGLIGGGILFVALYSLRHPGTVTGGPLADESENLMPPAIQRKPVGWTGYGVSGSASELPLSTRKRS